NRGTRSSRFTRRTTPRPRERSAYGRISGTASKARNGSSATTASSVSTRRARSPTSRTPTSGSTKTTSTSKPGQTKEDMTMNDRNRYTSGWKALRLPAALALLALTGAQAAAHHSAAMFDHEVELTLEGT